MLTIINLLIIIFIILISYQIFLAHFSNSIIEGLEDYKDYDTNDPNNVMILAQQNAGNIEVLKGRIDTLDGLKEKVDNNIQNINSLQTQMEGLVQQQADFAQQIAGSTPPTVTGTDS
jgi:methyl-accepting chemotaxis protein